MTGRPGGLLVVFPSSRDLEEAVNLLQRNGLEEFEALSPYHLESLSALVPAESTWTGNELGALTLAGGVAGMLTGFGMQWYAYSWSLPIDAGGRPLFSWPNFIPITFVLGILFAAGTLFLALWIRLQLPEPYHPVFHSPSFDLGAERFYLFVPEGKLRFPRATVEGWLRQIPAARLEEVPA